MSSSSYIGNPTCWAHEFDIDLKEKQLHSQLQTLRVSHALVPSLLCSGSEIEHSNTPRKRSNRTSCEPFQSTGIFSTPRISHRMRLCTMNLTLLRSPHRYSIDRIPHTSIRGTSRFPCPSHEPERMIPQTKISPSNATQNHINRRDVQSPPLPSASEVEHIDRRTITHAP